MSTLLGGQGQAGGATFTPTKANLYQSVKEIFHPATNPGVTADDANMELDVAAGGGASFLVSGVTAGTPQATDMLVFSDESADNDPNRKATIATILALGSGSFTPSKTNLYSAVKDILVHAGSDGASADDTNSEIDITRFAPTQSNLYTYVKSIIQASTNITVTADDANNELDIAAAATFSPSKTNLYSSVKEIIVGASNVTVTPDDANSELDISATGGGASFTVSGTTAGTPQATDMLVFSDESAAGDPNRKATISSILALGTGSFTPSKTNLYSAVKDILVHASSSAKADDTNSEIDFDPPVLLLQNFPASTVTIQNETIALFETDQSSFPSGVTVWNEAQDAITSCKKGDLFVYFTAIPVWHRRLNIGDLFTVSDVAIGAPVASDFLVFSDESATGDPNRRATISTILALGSGSFTPSKTNIYSAVKDIIQASTNITVSPDDTNSELDISATGGATFTPSKTNLYSSVKSILQASTNITITADDTNSELDISASGGGGSFTPSKTNLYSAVKDIIKGATNVTVTADDANSELDISATQRAAFKVSDATSGTPLVNDELVFADQSETDDPNRRATISSILALRDTEVNDQTSATPTTSDYLMFSDVSAAGSPNRKATISTILGLGTGSFTPSKTNLYSSVKAILQASTNITITADDANSELDISASGSGGASFTPTKTNLYSSVKSIIQASTNITVTADDANSELDIAATVPAAFTPSKTNLYSSVKAILVHAGNTGVTADDSNSEIDIAASGGGRIEPFYAYFNLGLYDKVADTVSDSSVLTGKFKWATNTEIILHGPADTTAKIQVGHRIMFRWGTTSTKTVRIDGIASIGGGAVNGIYHKRWRLTVAIESAVGGTGKIDGVGDGFQLWLFSATPIGWWDRSNSTQQPTTGLISWAEGSDLIEIWVHNNDKTGIDRETTLQGITNNDYIGIGMSGYGTLVGIAEKIGTTGGSTSIAHRFSLRAPSFESVPEYVSGQEMVLYDLPKADIPNIIYDREAITADALAGGITVGDNFPIADPPPGFLLEFSEAVSTFTPDKVVRNNDDSADITSAKKGDTFKFNGLKWILEFEGLNKSSLYPALKAAFIHTGPSALGNPARADDTNSEIDLGPPTSFGTALPASTTVMPMQYHVFTADNNAVGSSPPVYKGGAATTSVKKLDVFQFWTHADPDRWQYQGSLKDNSLTEPFYNGYSIGSFRHTSPSDSDRSRNQFNWSAATTIELTAKNDTTAATNLSIENFLKLKVGQRLTIAQANNSGFAQVKITAISYNNLSLAYVSLTIELERGVRTPSNNAGNYIFRIYDREPLGFWPRVSGSTTIWQASNPRVIGITNTDNRAGSNNNRHTKLLGVTSGEYLGIGITGSDTLYGIYPVINRTSSGSSNTSTKTITIDATEVAPIVSGQELTLYDFAADDVPKLLMHESSLSSSALTKNNIYDAVKDVIVHAGNVGVIGDDTNKEIDFPDQRYINFHAGLSAGTYTRSTASNDGEVTLNQLRWSTATTIVLRSSYDNLRNIQEGDWLLLRTTSGTSYYWWLEITDIENIAGFTTDYQQRYTFTLGTGSSTQANFTSIATTVNVEARLFSQRPIGIWNRVTTSPVAGQALWYVDLYEPEFRSTADAIGQNVKTALNALTTNHYLGFGLSDHKGLFATAKVSASDGLADITEFEVTDLTNTPPPITTGQQLYLWGWLKHEIPNTQPVPVDPKLEINDRRLTLANPDSKSEVTLPRSEPFYAGLSFGNFARKNPSLAINLNDNEFKWNTDTEISIRADYDDLVKVIPGNILRLKTSTHTYFLTVSSIVENSVGSTFLVKTFTVTVNSNYSARSTLSSSATGVDISLFTKIPDAIYNRHSPSGALPATGQARMSDGADIQEIFLHDTDATGTNRATAYNATNAPNGSYAYWGITDFDGIVGIGQIFDRETASSITGLDIRPEHTRDAPYRSGQEVFLYLDTADNVPPGLLSPSQIAPSALYDHLKRILVHTGSIAQADDANQEIDIAGDKISDATAGTPLLTDNLLFSDESESGDPNRKATIRTILDLNISSDSIFAAGTSTTEVPNVEQVNLAVDGVLPLNVGWNGQQGSPTSTIWPNPAVRKGTTTGSPFDADNGRWLLSDNSAGDYNLAWKSDSIDWTKSYVAFRLEQNPGNWAFNLFLASSNDTIVNDGTIRAATDGLLLWGGTPSTSTSDSFDTSRWNFFLVSSANTGNGVVQNPVALTTSPDIVVDLSVTKHHVEVNMGNGPHDFLVTIFNRRVELYITSGTSGVVAPVCAWNLTATQAAQLNGVNYGISGDANNGSSKRIYLYNIFVGSLAVEQAWPGYTAVNSGWERPS